MTIDPWDLNDPGDAREYLKLMAGLGVVKITEKAWRIMSDQDAVNMAARVFQDIQAPDKRPPQGMH